MSGIAGNYDAYQHWMQITHERAKYVQATLNMTDLPTNSKSSTWYRDIRPAEIQKSDHLVSEAQEAILLCCFLVVITCFLGGFLCS